MNSKKILSDKITIVVIAIIVLVALRYYNYIDDKSMYVGIAILVVILLLLLRSGQLELVTFEEAREFVKESVERMIKDNELPNGQIELTEDTGLQYFARSDGTLEPFRWLVGYRITCTYGVLEYCMYITAYKPIRILENREKFAGWSLDDENIFLEFEGFEASNKEMPEGENR